MPTWVTVVISVIIALGLTILIVVNLIGLIKDIKRHREQLKDKELEKDLDKDEDL